MREYGSVKTHILAYFIQFWRENGVFKNNAKRYDRKTLEIKPYLHLMFFAKYYASKIDKNFSKGNKD